VRTALENTVCSIASLSGHLTPEVVEVSKGCAHRVIATGCSDVALARSVQISNAEEACRKLGLENILLLDDDMVLSVSQAEGMLQACREEKVVFALYCDAQGSVMASWEEPGRHWLAGLGCWAMKESTLQRLGAPNIEHPQTPFRAYVRSGARLLNGKHRWLSEDFGLSWDLWEKGVQLVPGESVGHSKKVALYPNAEAVQKLLESATKEPNGGAR
jgi:hypothetical protein